MHCIGCDARTPFHIANAIALKKTKPSTWPRLSCCFFFGLRFPVAALAASFSAAAALVAAALSTWNSAPPLDSLCLRIRHRDPISVNNTLDKRWAKQRLVEKRPAWSYGPLDLCWRSAAQLRFLVAASSPPSKRGMPRTQIEDAQLTRAVTPKCAPTRLVRTERLSEKTRSWDCRCMTDDAYNRTWGFDECPREST